VQATFPNSTAAGAIPGQKTKRGCTEECQPNASDLRGGLVPCLADEIR
jgi:hypothetical protein